HPAQGRHAELADDRVRQQGPERADLRVQRLRRGRRPAPDRPAADGAGEGAQGVLSATGGPSLPAPAPGSAGGGEAASVARLVAWFDAHGADLPWRRTRDRYAVLVAEVQLQSTQVARVVPFYERWMARWPTAEALAAAPLGEVLAQWQGLGFPRRARNLHAAARAVTAGGWPQPQRLTELPGVGAYTAAA